MSAPAAGFGDIEFYPDFAHKVALLGLRITKNHPLPDGNKRVAYLCMVEFAERNGFTWEPPAGDNPDGEETVWVLEEVAASRIAERDFAEWVRARLKKNTAPNS